MTCAEARPLLHAHVDGELDLVRSLEVERHIQTCAACAAGEKSLRALRAALRDGDLACRAPNALRQKVRGIAPAPRGTGWQWPWKWIAIGATAFAALTLVLRPAGNSENDRLMDEAVAGHIRSLMAGHLTDVASSDQHTVKPWFDGRVDFAPDVKDFAAQEFPLIGGRLDYLDGHPVAALIYRHNKHVINVFVWPVAKAGEVEVRTENLRGYNVITRDANRLHYCLVSDLNDKELGELADLLCQ
jgi:anti-sigma factor RsiW